jgi:hypothetical protein
LAKANVLLLLRPLAEARGNSKLKPGAIHVTEINKELNPNDNNQLPL